MTPVWFGPTQFAIVELKPTPLDHWGAVSPAEEGAMCIEKLIVLFLTSKLHKKKVLFWINPPLLGAYTGWTHLRCYQMCYHSRRAFESLASITGRVDIAEKTTDGLWPIRKALPQPLRQWVKNEIKGCECLFVDGAGYVQAGTPC